MPTAKEVQPLESHTDQHTKHLSNHKQPCRLASGGRASTAPLVSPLIARGWLTGDGDM